MKQLHLLLGLLLPLSLAAQWNQQNDFDGAERFAATDFVVDGDAYILGGLIADGPNYIGYSEYYKYDPSTDSWSEEGFFPGGKIYAGISFVADGLAYVGLGANELGNQNNELWAFDPSSGLWIQRADFPGTTRVYAFSFAAGGKGYLGGGITWINGVETYLNDLWEYNPASNTWTQRANYPGGGRVGMSAFAVDDFGYVGMGDDGSFFYIDFYRYDPDNDNWISRANFEGDNRSFYSTEVLDGKGVVIGGEGPTSAYTIDVWLYEPTDDTWIEDLQFAGAPRAYGNFFLVDNALYYGLGLVGPSDSEGSTELWGYDLSLSSATPQCLTCRALQVFPNPVVDELQVLVPENQTLQQIRVYNTLGKIVLVETSGTVSLAELKSGFYLVEVETDLGTHTERVLKR